MRQKTGSIQARRGKFRISYYVDGLRQWETFATEEEALRELAKRLADTSQGVPVGSKPNTVLFEELARDVLNDYKFHDHASLPDQEARYRLHILPVFGKRKAATITNSQIKAYFNMRIEQGATIGTACRELQLMKHTFLLAMNEKPPKLFAMPKIKIPKEENIRQGIVEREQLEAVCRHLPKRLVPVARFGHITGWRHQEVMTRRVRHVSFELGTVVMEPGETKSGKGRTFPMVAELRELLESIWPEGPVFPNAYLFPGPPLPVKNADGTWKRDADGKLIKECGPILRFDKAWATACRKAGLPVRYKPRMRVNTITGKKEPVLYKRGPKEGTPIMVCRAAVYFHDFRRTAYTNLVRLGIPESVAQECVGWDDPDTARRYNITSQADLDVLRERYDAAAEKRENGARHGARFGKKEGKSS